MGIKVKREMLDLAINEYGSGKIKLLAKKMGISQSYIYQVIRQDIPVGNRFINSFMKLMRLSFSSLFYYEEDRKEEK